MDAAVRVRSTVTFMTRAALKRLAREAFFEALRHVMTGAGGIDAVRDEAHFDLWWNKQRPGLDDEVGPR